MEMWVLTGGWFLLQNELMSSRGFTPIIILLVVAILAGLAFLGYQYLSKRTGQVPAEIPMREEYENPFDEKAQYTNPFESTQSTEYKNPFDSLEP